ncbi:hypothetical protein F2Q68_00044859 [Brassica cretica]|uniref:ABC transporter domain-containing protein n=1 Tax=Brassica cretica TaxID=69181 RepID=A0A8S9LM67_BRACR|nr:hypothetical protein F2Q68_00044859 [Brassica cretica]
MANMAGADEIESLRVELAEIGRSIRSSFHRHTSSFRSGSSRYEPDRDGEGHDTNAEYALQWAEIERLPTVKRIRSTLLDDGDESMTEKGKRVVDVTKLGAMERHLMIEKLIKHIENDNLKLLKKIRRRIDRVGMELPTIEVRYEGLKVEAECEIVEGKALPTLWNTAKRVLSELVKLTGAKTREAKISILNDVSGIIKPGRLTLLLGPPGCGKTTLLKALSGNLENNLKCSGEISYNGHRLDEFVPQKTSAYISQYDLHIAEMTVRETVDFSARCQGVGSRTEIMMEVSKREKEAGIIPDTEVDAYMKAISVEGLERSLQTDYILKILGLDICAETLIGDVMRRGISGGQKKRLTTAEMIVGPTKALFMDEITNGLDSSTAFQIVKSLQQLAHISNATVVVSLLQPAPESFDLFDDVMLMAKGKIVYHGPRGEVLNFFEECGFQCPERKGVADYLQEVISRKDQAQYWRHEDLPYSFVSVDMLSKKFKDFSIGKKIEEALSKPYDRSKSHKDALSFSVYSLPNWEMFIACISREYLLMKRNYFVYIFKTGQLVMAAFITMTVFIRTRMGIDILHGNSYMSALFFAVIILLVDGFPELAMTAQRLAVFYKQKQLCFYPAWAYAIPATVLKVPLSLLESFVWTGLTYYVIGYTPEASRFFKQFILLFLVHFTSISMFRCLAAIFQTIVASVTAGSFGILITFVFAGFVIPPPSMPAWLKWGFWANPLSYSEIGLSVNEFLAPRWSQIQPSTNLTLGRTILESRGLNYDGYMYWVSLCALVGFTVLFNTIFTLALTFLKSPTSSRAMISQEKLSELQGTEDTTDYSSIKKKTTDSPVKTEGKMVLPFKPLTVTFQELNYFVDTPVEMREQGFANKKLQLLTDITGAFRPGILTALMGVSGAGKTTLLDVLAGRKTSGYIEGDIRISGFPKVQETFARVSGYCEQTDIHSPNITVEESNVPGVPKIRDNHNPATWMLDVSSQSAEVELSVDFAKIYNESALFKSNSELVKQLSQPDSGSSDLQFKRTYAQSWYGQFKSIWWKMNLSYWRNPSYNLMRLIHTLISSLIFGALFWKQGQKIDTQQSVFTVVGAIYGAVLFLGINNCSSAIRNLETERNVMYRERFAGMYSATAYALGQVVTEIPYLFIQAAEFVIITYPMIGFYASTYKVFWALYSMFTSLLTYNYLAMFLISITPNFMVASILQSIFYVNFNLFSGFLIPETV